MKLGADPEVFLVDGAGKHLSAIGRIGGDKYNPLQVEGLEKGFTLQEDNVALEFGIPPAATADEFVKHIRQVMFAGLAKVGNNLKFSTLSCTIFPPDQMKNPAAYVFGCEPDFNAWTKEENAKPKPPHVHMRSAGGHIHVGDYKGETNKDVVTFTRFMDLYLGVPSVIMDKEGGTRRRMYGKRGAFRVKPYGFEYRTLSNFWIFHDDTIRWAFRNAERAMKSDVDVSMLDSYIEDAIDNGNVGVARDLVKEFNLEVV